MTIPISARNVMAPGPRGSLLLGLARDLQRDPLGTFERAAAGHGDVVRLVAGPPGRRVALHLVSHPDGVQHVLTNTSEAYTRGAPRPSRSSGPRSRSSASTSGVAVAPRCTCPRHWPTPAQRRAADAQRSLYQIVDAIIDQRDRAPSDQSDLISLLLAARDPQTGTPLSAQDVRDQILIFLLAGHETTSTALTFTCDLLGHHRDQQRRVHQDSARSSPAGP